MLQQPQLNRLKLAFCQNLVVFFIFVLYFKTFKKKDKEPFKEHIQLGQNLLIFQSWIYSRHDMEP